MSSERILVGLPTKDRDVVLGAWIASMLNQSFQDFDVAILNDGSRPIGHSKTTGYLLEHLRNGRDVWIEEGSHISQAHNHNMILYDPRWRDYRYIFRCDDDLMQNRFTLEYLYETMQRIELLGKSGPIGAIGGLWFDVSPPENFSDLGDRKSAPDPLSSHLALTGKVAAVNSNWQQRMYHPTDEPFETEHIYSNCLYNAKLMRKAGGWPEVYARGVAHGEETDGTYRLHLSGARLLIDPRVTGNHLRCGGGIRSTRDLSQVQSMDLMKWQTRLPKFARINFQPTVAIECRHCYGFGGAERLFYHTVHLLQEHSGLEVVDPIFPSRHFSPEQCEQAFGFSFEEPTGALEQYDILIVLGHDTRHKTKARHKIQYCFFPKDDQDLQKLQEFDLLVGISDYTTKYIGELWRYEAERIYPPVEPIGQDDVLKQNMILVVSRCVPQKAPKRLMEWFIEFGFDKQGYQLHVVTSASTEAFDEYKRDTLAYASAHPSIVVHENISDKKLKQLYRQAKVLWSANGMMSEAPQAAEHFGYTPIEAWSARCMPVVYDRGGHQETVHPNLRWKKPEELNKITRAILADDFVGLDMLGRAPVETYKYFPGQYVQQWEDYIRRVNAMAFELQKIERISISQQPIRVAMLCDGPYMPDLGIGITTGFGIVGGQILKHMIQDEELQVTVYGLMDTKFPRTTQRLPFDYRPLIEDMECRHSILDLIQWSDPEVLFTIHAPGETYGWVQQLDNIGKLPPTVSYFPVEGVHRINRSIVGLVDKVTIPVTYCHNARKMIEPHVEKPIKVAFHGSDHADFGPMEPEKRERLRTLIGWDDKFCAGMMGTNKRVKNQVVLIKAIKLLLERGHDDIYLYLHTRKFDRYIMQGWNLADFIETESELSGLPLKEHVMFPMDYNKWHGPAYDGIGLETWQLSRPPDPKMRGALFNALSFIERYCLLDLYVEVSSAEGWSLCSLESAACGVPTISVSDGVARSEIHSKYCHMLEPEWFDTWHTGTDLAMVSPEQVAEKIVELKENDALRNQFADAQSHIFEDLPWETTAKKFIEWIKEAYAIPS